MTERVDIANMALSWLGEEEITSLEDQSKRALQMKINYIPARDATLEAHDWSFAIKRFIPAKLETPPVYGAAYAFSIPSDILRVISVDTQDTLVHAAFNTPINSDEQVDWVFEDRMIICNEDAVSARGIRRVQDEGKFSPLFVQAFAAKLASLTALNLTGSAEIQGNMFNLFVLAIKEAKTRDGLQGRSRRIRNRSLLKRR